MATIQSPIGIPEPTNDVDSLWRTTQALKEAVEILQGTRGNRPAALQSDLDIVGDTVTTIISGGGGGITSLVDLTDTDLIGQVQYDMFFNADGTEWQNTAGELIWNPDLDYLQLANEHSINWLTVGASSVEFLNFFSIEETVPGDTVVLLDFNDGTEGGSSATNRGSAGAVTFQTNATTTSGAAFEGAFGGHIIGASSSNFKIIIDDGAVTDAFGMNGNDFTVHFYYKFFEQSGSNFICEARSGATDGDWTIQLDGFKRIEIRVNNISQILWGTALTASTWYHVAMTHSGTTLRLFVDGILRGTKDTTSTVFPAGDSDAVWMGRFHTMDIDGLLIVKNHALWTEGFTPPTAPGPTSEETFVVGDPVFPTVIDGLRTDITSATTNIEGALNVIGDVSMTNIDLTEKVNVSVTTVVTTSYTAAAEHVILVDDDTAAATVTVTLPTAATGNTIYHIKKLGTTASVVIDGAGGELIDGAFTITLNRQHESVMLISDGTFWSII